MNEREIRPQQGGTAAQRRCGATCAAVGESRQAIASRLAAAEAEAEAELERLQGMQGEPGAPAADLARLLADLPRRRSALWISLNAHWQPATCRARARKSALRSAL
jgi:hypothetical protein